MGFCRRVKNLKSDLWQNVFSSLKARSHLHNVGDYYYHGGDDDVYDKGNEVEDEDTSQLSSPSSLLKSGSK